MSVIYSQAAINARLSAVASLIDAGAGNGLLQLFSGASLLATITLNKPSATVAAGVMTFSTTTTDGIAVGNGPVTEVKITDSTTAVIISGLTGGIPGSGAEVIITNGSNSTVISGGQIIHFLAGQITGS